MEYTSMQRSPLWTARQDALRMGTPCVRPRQGWRHAGHKARRYEWLSRDAPQARLIPRHRRSSLNGMALFHVKQQIKNRT
jgi:hypothetical protein